MLWQIGSFGEGLEKACVHWIAQEADAGVRGVTHLCVCVGGVMSMQDKRGEAGMNRERLHSLMQMRERTEAQLGRGSSAPDSEPAQGGLGAMTASQWSL